jgi:capsular polysaccharide biosynthesis protein
MQMSENVELGLKDFIKFLTARIWVVLLSAAILGSSMLFYSKSVLKPQYEASVSIYVNNISGVEGNRISSSDLQVAMRLVATYINIIQSDTVLDKVIETCGVNLDAGQLREMISAKSIGETEMFRVTVRSYNPQMSMDLANVIAEIAPGVINQYIVGSTTQVVDWAKLPKEPCAPNHTLNAVIGVMLGLVLSILGLLVYMLVDTRIKGEEDIGKICAIPVMGVIPNLSTDTKKPARKGKR